MGWLSGHLYRRLAVVGLRHEPDPPLFPHLAPVLASRPPAYLVLDGEAIVWNTAAGRLHFGARYAAAPSTQ
jgi:hypothetical protein